MLLYKHLKKKNINCIYDNTIRKTIAIQDYNKYPYEKKWLKLSLLLSFQIIFPNSYIINEMQKYKE